MVTNADLNARMAHGFTAGSLFLMWDTFVDALDILRARREQKKKARRHLDIKYGLPGAEDISTADTGDGSESSALDDDAWDSGWLFDHGEKTNPCSPTGSEPLHHHEISDKHCQMQYIINRNIALRKKLIKYDRHGGVSKGKHRAARRLLGNSATMDYPYLYEWRWEIIVGSSTGVVVGKGDLVLTDGRGTFAVIKLDDGGRSTSSRRVNALQDFGDNDTTQQRRSNAQALRHARIYGRLHPQATSVIPMLMNHEDLFMYKNEEWSKYRTISTTTRFGLRSMPTKLSSIALGPRRAADSVVIGLPSDLRLPIQAGVVGEEDPPSPPVDAPAPAPAIVSIPTPADRSVPAFPAALGAPSGEITLWAISGEAFSRLLRHFACASVPLSSVLLFELLLVAMFALEIHCAYM